MSNFRKLNSFTLLEALISLLLLSLVCLIFHAGVRQLRYLQQYSLRTTQEDFNVFMLQLRHEIKTYTYLEIYQGALFLQDHNLATVKIEKHSSLIRKVDNGGHHPLLMGVQAWTVTELDNGWTIEVIFSNGQTEAGFLAFPQAMPAPAES